MKLDIIKYGGDQYNILRKANIDAKNNEHLKTLIINMFETLDIEGGIGLAAPQVGKNLNLFILSMGNWKEVFINPKIYPYGYNCQMEEGCLSIPGIPIVVTRHDKVKIQYYDKNWAFHNVEFDGLISRAIQHEYDHLIGKLIIDY